MTLETGIRGEQSVLVTAANTAKTMGSGTLEVFATPALVALAAWLNDQQDLAQRALAEAIRRDDEKTSLLFSLVSRRAGRLSAACRMPVVWRRTSA